MAPGQAAHAEHDRTGQRGPGGRQPSSDVTANPASVRASTTSTNTGTGTVSVAGVGSRPTARSRAKKPTQQQEFDGDRGQPRRRHHRGEVEKREPRGGERQQVGQVGHRKQQRGGVGQVRGGIRVRAGPAPTARASSRAPPGSAARRSHPGSIPPWWPAPMTNTCCQQASRGCPIGRPRHRRARRAEQALVVAQLRQHEHRGEEADDGQQPAAPRRPHRAAETTPSAISRPPRAPRRRPRASPGAGPSRTRAPRPARRSASVNSTGQRAATAWADAVVRRRRRPARTAPASRRRDRRRHTEAPAAAWSAAGRSRPSG